MRSLEDLAGRVQAATGGCRDAKRLPVSKQTVKMVLSDLNEGRTEVWLPFVADVGTCLIDDDSMDRLDMIVFVDGRFAEFQTAWRDFSRARDMRLRRTVFGNGYAVILDDADDMPRIVGPLGMKYLRCDEVTELNAEKISSDVEGCVFSNVG